VSAATGGKAIYGSDLLNYIFSTKNDQCTNAKFTPTLTKLILF
jgi:hypothetical protein